jgi:hypothetical protein
MKIRYLLVLVPFLLVQANAAPEHMTVSVWDPGCNHTMTTNHFVLAPGESTMEIYVDLSDCTDEQVGSMLIFGYVTTKNSSRQLSSKNNVSFHATTLNKYGSVSERMHSDSGGLLAKLDRQSRGVSLFARNNSRNKEIKIRLRSQLLAP